MPKNISDNDLYSIETLLADRHDGWRIGEIEKALESQGLSLLHEGNFARYRLRPAEFNDWQKRKK